MRYISLFSGIEAASVGWRDLPLEPVAFSEIAPFQCKVLRRHYPTVPNLGDITKIDWSDYAGTIDIIVGGSPCQSFSVAGNWKDEDVKGLSGQSGLMFEYIRAVREVRPRYFIWENVTGALSSEDGAAFGQLITEMDELGYSMCWRVLDSQYFGVPQMRRRVFVVGHIGDKRVAGTILLEPEVVFEHNQSCKGTRIQSTLSRENSTFTWCAAGSTINRQSCWDGPNTMGLYYEVSPTRTASFAPHAIISYDIDTSTSCVRRFTPHELERLFGFPDGYVSDTTFKGKKPNYRQVQQALGNSFCVPVIKWIGERLYAADECFYS